jgi:hypothetical protein
LIVEHPPSQTIILGQNQRLDSVSPEKDNYSPSIPIPSPEIRKLEDQIAKQAQMISH